MSKSYKNTIPLFGSTDEIAKAVMSIVTDSSGERPENVYAIHSLFRTKDELDTLYKENKGMYKNLKDALIVDAESFIAPLRARRESITDADVFQILKDGTQKAQIEASKKMKIVKERVGLTL